MSKEKSKSGAPVYRYDDKEAKGFTPPTGESSIEEISDHIEKHIGKIHRVFHEIVSDKVHLDVYWVLPTKDRPYQTLVTSGMSDLPMTTPAGIEDHQFAELSICLPPEWPLEDNDLKNEKNYWPVRWLKQLARFPHEYSTWLGWGHTIPNGDPAQPFSKETKLNTMLLLPSILFEPRFHELQLENKTIRFYTLYPLYSEEVQLKMDKGVEALFEGFEKHRISDVLELNRPNSVAKKKRFGLF
jgi:hypothetical protein